MSSRNVIIAPTTAIANGVIKAGQTVEPYENTLPLTVVATGLAGTEQVTFQFSPDSGSTWQDLYINGAPVALKVDDNAFAVYSPMYLKAIKPATASPVGVFIMWGDSIG